MHKPIPVPSSLRVEGFMAKVDRRHCWLWLGALNEGGYGRFQGCMAHRVSHTWFNDAIPDAYEVDHLCRNPRCVRPSHLEAVTPQENQRRASRALLSSRSAKGRSGEPPCTCWVDDGHLCELQTHIRVPPERRVRIDGLDVGDLVPIRWVQLFVRMPRCPQCGKTMALGDRTACNWCGLLMLIVGDDFLVTRTPLSIPRDIWASRRRA
jgi:hypothetical protein